MSFNRIFVVGLTPKAAFGAPYKEDLMYELILSGPRDVWRTEHLLDSIVRLNFFFFILL